MAENKQSYKNLQPPEPFVIPIKLTGGFSVPKLDNLLIDLTTWLVDTFSRIFLVVWGGDRLGFGTPTKYMGPNIFLIAVVFERGPKFN